MPCAGDLVTLSIEKPAAGGRMLARHAGQVVLVAGAIPGERVRARVERVRGGVVFARTEGVDEASPDRRPEAGEQACGGSDYGHIAYERQLALKEAIVRDAFGRIAKLPLEIPIVSHRSPEPGTGCGRACTLEGPGSDSSGRGHTRSAIRSPGGSWPTGRWP